MVFSGFDAGKPWEYVNTLEKWLKSGTNNWIQHSKILGLMKELNHSTDIFYLKEDN